MDRTKVHAAQSAAFLTAINVAAGAHHLGSELWLGWWLAKVDEREATGYSGETATVYALEEAERISPECAETVRRCLGR